MSEEHRFSFDLGLVWTGTLPITFHLDTDANLVHRVVLVFHEPAEIERPGF